MLFVCLSIMNEPLIGVHSITKSLLSCASATFTLFFTPPEKTGLFQGIRMIFVVLLPMVVGPAIGDLACRHAGATYTNEYGVETIVPDATMFLYSAIIAILVFIPLLIVKKKGLDKKES